MMIDSDARRSGDPTARLILCVIVAIVGLWLLGFGAWLAVLGGSIYYVLAGIALLGSAWLLFRGRSAGLFVYAAVLIVTMAWALWEVGFDFWQLAPRGDLLVPLGILLLLPWVTRGLAPRAQLTSGAGLALALSLLLSGGIAITALFNHPNDQNGVLPSRSLGSVAYFAAPGDWPAYAGTWAGLKWSPLAQIRPDNVKKLDVAWHVHTGDLKRPSDPGEFTYEMTPIKVGDLLYLCTPHDIVIALDPVTGKTRWRFDPHVNVNGTQHMSCRGVSYYDSNAAPGGPPMPPRAQDCSTRIFVATNDARLIALDAASGRPCADFGNGGQLSLVPQYPGYREGWYQFTSAPLVTRGLVVLAGAVFDNRSVKMPSGVVRAFDAKSGRLVWNFDPGNPNQTAPIGPNQRYSLSSPNSWSTSAADEQLGMIYLPFGMGAVDQYGAQAAAHDRAIRQQHRRARQRDRQAQMGVPDRPPRPVGHGRPAQPALIDLPIGGATVPALVQTTKTGNIFVLDRRTGKPIVPVTERAVPDNPAPGDTLSATQPFSALSLMPLARIREADMWGATMLDQLSCRIAFRKLRYDGVFTPPSTQGSLVYPGNFGVMDWGGMAYDPVHATAFANPDYMAFLSKLTAKRPADGRRPRPTAGSIPIMARRLRSISIRSCRSSACRARRRLGARLPGSTSPPARSFGSTRTARCATRPRYRCHSRWACLRSAARC